MGVASIDGSKWRKWDLHVHSPSSIVHNYPGDTEAAWEAFLSDLEGLPCDFKVVGINDYIFLEGYQRAVDAKKKGRLKNIDLLLPVVEFRLDKFAGTVKKGEDGAYSQSDWNRINLHVIFDALEPELIRQQFLNTLAPSYNLIPEATQLKGKWKAVITPTSLAELGQAIIDAAPEHLKKSYGTAIQEGFNNLCVSLESIQNALDIHPLANKFLLAVGKTEWENMKWTGQSIAEKRNVINSVNLVFTASDSPAAYAQSIAKLREAKVNSKLLDCSDAHSLSTSESKDRIGHCYTWIKADPTFAGLRQALREFEQRVYVGDMPPKRELVSKNQTKYISAIRIAKKPGSGLPHPWFNLDMPLNHDLVAVIGNKGSGKSALADVIALVGSTKNFQSFSFLTESRFRDPKAKLAQNFVGELQWADGSTSSRELGSNPGPSDPERVKYLPQSYLETLCNELEDGSASSTFDSELRKIIFTHVPEEDRLGLTSLDALLQFRVSELDRERVQQMQQLSRVNDEIAGIEARLTIQARESLRLQLESKERELRALESARPATVEDPSVSDAAQEEMNAAGQRLQLLETQGTDLRKLEQATRDKKALLAKRVAVLSRASQAIGNFQSSFETFVSELSEAFDEAGTTMDVSSVVRLSIDSSALLALIADTKRQSEAEERLIAGPGQDSYPARRHVIEDEIKKIKSKLDERQRLFVVYREQIQAWERMKIELIGDGDRPGTIEGLKGQIAELGLLPARLQSAIVLRMEVVRRVHGLIRRTVDEYRRLYQPVQAFVASAANMEMPLPLAFSVRIVERGFQDEFFARINRQARGTFSGIEESSQLLQALLKETDFESEVQSLEFVSKVNDMLHTDRREGMEARVVHAFDQVRKGSHLKEVYDHLCSLRYLRPQYSLTYGGQEIGKLSPGERGLLLLVFYLLVDKEDIPIVIDQPEENLDNQTIYKILVTCLKAAKQRRQVFMVTHNPNLAVVCDAEQIVSAACDKNGNLFSYTSGAIESDSVRERVVEVLEGTEPAFVNRKTKYGL